MQTTLSVLDLMLVVAQQLLVCPTDCAIMWGKITTPLFEDLARWNRIIRPPVQTYVSTVSTSLPQLSESSTAKPPPDETTGFLPRVNVCADGSLCCDAFPNCCEAGQGIFLDSTGQVVSSLQSTSSSTTFTSSKSTSAATSASAAASPTSSSPLQLSNSPTSSPSPGLSSGAKAGIVIGAVFGVVIIAALVVLICIQHRRLKQERPVPTTYIVPPDVRQFSSHQMPPKELDSQSEPYLAELPGNRG
jgi:hypothetical protein